MLLFIHLCSQPSSLLSRQYYSFFFSFYIKHQKKCPTLVLILLYVNCTSDRGDQLATFSTKNFASVVPGSPERVKKAGTFLGTKTMSEQLNIDR